MLWLIGVHGRFGEVRGSIAIDRFRDSVVVDARIDTAHVRMRNHKYEAWVKSAEFFDAEHYPQIHFVSEPFPLGRLRSGGEIDGTLTMRGIDKSRHPRAGTERLSGSGRHGTARSKPSAASSAATSACTRGAARCRTRSIWAFRSM